MPTLATDGVLEAVKAIFDADAGLQTAGFTQLFAGRAPKTSAGLQFPYAIYTSIRRLRLETTSDAVIFSRPLEITLYGRTEEEVAGYVDLLAVPFPENVKLTLPSPYQFKSMRVGDVDVMEEGDRVWKAVVPYSVVLTKDK